MNDWLDRKPKIDRRRPARGLVFETLEARLLLSADIAPLALAVHDAFPPLAAEHRLLDAVLALPAIDSSAIAARAREVVFVDASLPDRERLVAEVLAASGGARDAEVLFLDPGRDGIAQISEALATRGGLAAVHLVTHGGDGRIELGAATLDASVLAARGDAIAGWASAFAGDGDLLVYGCNVAASDAGKVFLGELARTTGADVAASDDLTGRGGDWQLEFATAAIETPIAFTSAIDTAWTHTLATFTADWNAQVAGTVTETTPGSNTHVSTFNVGVGTVSVTVADPLNKLGAGPVVSSALTGGFATDRSLELNSSGYAPGQSSTITVSFAGYTGSISNVRFMIFDVDTGDNGTGFVDQLVFTANGGAFNPTSVSVGPGASVAAGFGVAPVEGGNSYSYNNFDGVNTVTGRYSLYDPIVGDPNGEDNAPSNRSNGNVYVVFGQTGITGVSFSYQNPRAASGQGIALHDIRFDVNDPPTSTNDAVSTAEDTPLVLGLSDFGTYADVEGTPIAAVRISALASDGQLQHDSTGLGAWAAVAPNDVISAAEIGAGRLRVVPDPNETGAPYATLGFEVSDGSAFSAATYTLTVSVTPVADQPTLTVNPATGNEDSAIPITIATALVDTDGSETLAVTIAAIPIGATLSDGVTSFTATAGSQSVVVSSWNLVLLRIVPPANSTADFALTVTATATEGANGAAATSTANLAVDVVPLNDPPAVATNTGLGVNEGAGVTLTNAALRATDPDNVAADLVYTVTAAPASGRIAFFAAPGVAINLFTQADLDAGLVRYVHDGSETAADGFTFVVADGAGGATGATAFAIGVTAVNDAPVNTLPAAITVTEDVASALTGISVADTDSAGAPVAVTLSAPGGTFAALAGGGVAVAGSGSGALTLTGTTIAINAFIAGAGVTYTTALDATAAVTLTVTVDDRGNTGIGGALTDSDTTTLNVIAVNDGPTVIAPGAIAVTEDQASPLVGIAVNDADGPGNVVSLALSVGSGTLWAASGAEVAVAGSGTGSLALVGTVTAINAFIAGGGVAFLTVPDDTGAVSIVAIANDVGSSGTGGAFASTPANAMLNVAPVNDSPVLGAVTLSIDPLQSVTMTGGNMSATDVDDPVAGLVFLVAGTVNGRFELASAPGVPVSSFTQAQLAAGQVRFVHTNAGLGPAYSIFVTDGQAVAGPGIAVVSFRAPGFEDTPRVPRVDEPGGGVSARPSVLSSSIERLAEPSALAFVRTALGGGEDAAVNFAQAPQVEMISVAHTRARGAADTLLGAGDRPMLVFAEMDAIPTAAPALDFRITPLRHAEDPQQSLDIALDSIRVSGMALSVGMVWWAARAGGLLASLMASAPAWRHVDPLPVLGHDREEPEIDWSNPGKEPPPEEDRAVAEMFARGDEQKS